MENTQGHVGKMETQLKQWGARLDQIVAKAEKAGTEVNGERRKRVDELKAKYQAAQSKIGEFKAAGSEKWEVFKTGVETAWSDLEAAFKKLKS
ncbi:MAG: coiled coil domain-containing protein [Polyangia bacterium]|jgi:peptidoglycan hydrolase CwlO-like protein